MNVVKSGKENVVKNCEVDVGKSCSGNRRDRLKKVLNIPQEGVELEQVKKLEEHLLSSHDVFSLDDDDLGHTSLVRHRVETGDHPPIKQSPCRIPFS